VIGAVEDDAGIAGGPRERRGRSGPRSSP